MRCAHIRRWRVDVIRMRPDGETVAIECEHTALDAEDASMMAIMRTQEMMGAESRLVSLFVTDLGALDGRAETDRPAAGGTRVVAGAGGGAGDDAQ